MTSTIQKYILQLISSLGLKRKLSSLFQALVPLVGAIPGLQIFASSLQAIASWLGVIGVSHATLTGTIKLDLNTITAFFAALILAAQGNPEIAVYLPVIKVISYILGLFNSVQLLGNRED